MWVKVGEITAHVLVDVPQCSVCRRRDRTRLCDFPTRPGKTCDRALCDTCTNRGDGEDRCPKHAGKATQLGLTLGDSQV